uniref:Pfam-B_13725 domain containing protein n=1 Tax=Echinococcus granulosus TaxID=6210 RepID=A0A068WM40_ECHGR|nr:Pfam-B_13725 domain containing protein [Echinococcus granulosus]
MQLYVTTELKLPHCGNAIMYLEVEDDDDDDDDDEEEEEEEEEGYASLCAVQVATS